MWALLPHCHLSLAAQCNLLAVVVVVARAGVLQFSPLSPNLLQLNVQRGHKLWVI